jgi:hypothetical protein
MTTDQTTFITLAGLTFGLAMCFLMLVLPRRWALVPVFALTCYMTLGERLVVATLDFTMLRLLILSGAVRLLLRQEFRGVRLNIIDKVFLLYALFSIVTYTALRLTPDALIYRLGRAYDAVGLYFLFRCLVRDMADVKHAFRTLAVMVVPLALVMLVERTTQRNLFAVFGGVPAFTAIRDGVLRGQGPFGHPILAGAFGATLLPVFAALWWLGRNKALAIVGAVSSIAIILAAGSSTPLISALAGAVGLAFWPLRRHMRTARWTLLLALIGLQAVMQAPVWFLIARVSVFSASTAYHRANLIDKAIRNVGEWWLLGTESTDHWGHNLFDIANQFVRVAVDGGLVTLVLFVLVIAHCFRGVGAALQARRHEAAGDQRLVWALGAALFAHVITFLGVSYFDQNIVGLYLVLAGIAALSGNLLPQAQPSMAPRSRVLVTQQAAAQQRDLPS